MRKWPKHSRKKGALTKRDNRRLTPAQQEAVVRTYFTIGTIQGTAKKLGIANQTVHNALKAMQTDPTLVAARGQALDQMAGKIHAVTDAVIDSITPEELVTTRREVRDRAGNLMRVVIDGPSLKDKALTISTLADKQRTLAEAKQRAAESSVFKITHSDLMLPDTIEDKRLMIASMVKRLRVVDVYMRDDESQQNINRLLNKVGIHSKDIEEAEIELIPGVAPFD